MASLNRLSAIAIRKLAPGKYADGGNLWLVKRADGGGQWVFRFAIHGRRREMGLGSITSVPLKDARAQAERWRSVVAGGGDPIRVRDDERKALAVVRPLLSEVANQCFEARKADLKNDGKAGGWFSPIERHVLPKLGRVPIEDIDQRHVVETLKPIWQEKAETARKCLSRLSIILRFGAALGLDTDMQATAKARELLGGQRDKSKNIPAMPWPEVPAFYASLRESGGVVDLCLAFVILTAVRSGEARAAHWSEIDIESKIWTIPAARMKGGIEHRVPLSIEAIAVLEAVRPSSRDGLVFPSPRKGCVSDMATGMLMRRRGLSARPHGFRSSFRDWVAETTDTPREVAERCLAHVTGSDVEKAYRRTDFLERRAVLMERWSDHCGVNSQRWLN